MSTPRTPILWSVRPTYDAVQRALDDERRDRVVGPAGRIGRLREDRVPVRLTDTRHPALGAGQHPAAVDSGSGTGSGPHPHHVATGLRLGQPERGAAGSRRRSRSGTGASGPLSPRS